MSKELDQRLHEWLFPDGCWHEWVADPFPGTTVAICRRCDENIDYMPDPNPHYSSDGNAMLSLKAALVEKGCRIETWWRGKKIEAAIYYNFKQISDVEADTEPLAVALAADKVREMEAENG